MLRYYARHTALGLGLLLLTLSVTAQKADMSDDRKWLKADRALDLGNYYGALVLYNDLYPRDSMNQELNYKLGVCHFEIRRLRDKSYRYFKKVTEPEFVEVNYYMGRLKHIDGDFNEAIQYYSDYLAARAFKRYTDEEISDLIAKSRTAIKYLRESDGEIVVRNLGTDINSEESDYGPLIATSENVIYFTSRRQSEVWPDPDPFGNNFENIYTSTRTDEGWTSPSMIEDGVNTAMHDAATSLSADGESMLFFRTSEDLLSGNIYEATLDNGRWTAPKPLGAIVNSEGNAETSACYGPDGDIIFFSSNRPGGFGGKDLYVVKKLPNGEWATPYNLGPNINTPYDEDAPFVHPSGKVLFFSSGGHENMGGFDVFQSDFDEMGMFSKPTNLGYPINTVDDDIFFVLNGEASVGYLSSQREDGLGGQDLYEIHFTPEQSLLKVFHFHVYSESGELIKNNVKVFFADPETGQVIGQYSPDKRTGKMLVISEPNQSYNVRVTADGYQSKEMNLTLKRGGDNRFTLAPESP